MHRKWQWQRTSIRGRRPFGCDGRSHENLKMKSPLRERKIHLQSARCWGCHNVMPCRHTEANHTATPLLQMFEIAASIPIDSTAQFVRTSNAPILQTEAFPVESLDITLSGTFIPSCPWMQSARHNPISIQSMLNTSWPVCKGIAKAWKWRQLYWYKHIFCVCHFRVDTLTVFAAEMHMLH